MSEHSKAALAYVNVRRNAGDRECMWMDVARAYDAGMRHGLEARSNALRQVRTQSRGAPKCSVCGFAESAGVHTHHLIGKTAPMGGEFHAFTLEAAGG